MEAEKEKGRKERSKSRWEENRAEVGRRQTTETSKSIIKAEKGTKPRKKKANKGINRKTIQKPVFPPC